MEESSPAVGGLVGSSVQSIDSDATAVEDEKPLPKPSEPPQLQHDEQTTNPQNSIYAAVLLGLAMTTRGEIGFLVAAVAQSAGVLQPPDVYIVIMWAIILCTLLGPIGVGLIARKIKGVATTESNKIAILGKWG